MQILAEYRNSCIERGRALEESNKQSYIRGAAILTATMAITKVIGLIYKVPLYNILGDEGTAHFTITYTIYNLLLTISTAGVPVALSRLISEAHSIGRDRQADRIFSVSMPSFIAVGIVCAAVMLIWAQGLANLIGDPEIPGGIRCLAPAVFFCCIIAVYRGYSQGHEDMFPTAISQIMEVLCKLLFGLVIAWILLKRGANTATISAGAIVGVTIGLMLSVPIMSYYKHRTDKTGAYNRTGEDQTVLSRRETFYQIFKTSIPITLGSSVLNIISLVDTKLVLLRLQTGAGYDYMTAKILFGAYSKALTLFNLPSAFIVPITISVVPAIAAALANRDRKTARRTMTSSLKVTNLIGLPAGAGLCVLSYSIYTSFYWGSHESGPALLALAGIASYFVCLQLVTTAMLQACGYEQLSMLTLPIGGIVKVIATWILVGSPKFGIFGAPLSTLICYLCISAFNIFFICRKVKARPNFRIAFVIPVLSTAVMTAVAGICYGIGMKLAGSWFSAARLHMLIIMGISIVAAVIVYAVLIVVLGGITKEDMELVPKGERIARALKLR